MVLNTTPRRASRRAPRAPRKERHGRHLDSSSRKKLNFTCMRNVCVDSEDHR